VRSPAPRLGFGLRAATAAALTVALAASTARSAAASQALPPDAPAPAATPATPAPAEAPAEAPAAAAPPAAPSPPPPAADLSSKLEEADQLARVAARRVELLEEQIAARAKDSPTALADDKGFGLRSADGLFVVRIKGQLQTDARFFLGDAALADKDTFLIRRLRPTLAGTFLDLADFLFVPDLAGSQVVVFDAYVDVHPTPFARLRVGKFKTPLGLERLQADNDLPLVERALTSNLTPTRDVGAALWGEIAGGLIGYSIGVYNGATDGANPDLDTNYAKDFTGRILLQPFKTPALQRLGSLGLHLAASTGNRKGLPTNPLLPTFRTAGQNTFFSYYAPSPDPTGAGTTFAHLTQRRLNPGLYYYFGPFGLLGEVVWSQQEVQKGNATAVLTHRAGHISGSYVIGGRNGFDGATPDRPFNLRTGDLGALELSARYNYLTVDDTQLADFIIADAPPTSAFDPLKSATKAQGWAVGANFVPHRVLRFSTAYERTSFTGGAAAADKKTVANRNTESVVFGRVQVNF
jgi:phosphate-selective porin OprO/OprP